MHTKLENIPKFIENENMANKFFDGKYQKWNASPPEFCNSDTYSVFILFKIVDI